MLDRRRNVNIAQGLAVATTTVLFCGVGWFLYGNLLDALRCGFWGVLVGGFVTGLFLMFTRIVDRRRPS